MHKGIAQESSIACVPAGHGASQGRLNRSLSSFFWHFETLRRVPINSRAGLQLHIVGEASLLHLFYAARRFSLSSRQALLIVTRKRDWLSHVVTLLCFVLFVWCGAGARVLFAGEFPNVSAAPK